MNSLTSGNQVALVTGAAQGIGQAIALELARVGMDVVVNDIQDADETLGKVRQLGREALYVRADVSDREAVRAMFSNAVEEFGHIDAVVSNAMWSKRETVTEADWDDFRRVVEINQFGLFHVCQAAAQQMVRQCEAGRTGGTITVIGSVHAHLVFANNAAYAMSKAAAAHFARVLAKEMLPYQIRVNTVHPGWTDTPGERRYLDEAALQEAAKALPFKRLATAEEIAKTVAFLVGDAAGYITGASLGVDGGVLIAPESVCEQR